MLQGFMDFHTHAQSPQNQNHKHTTVKSTGHRRKRDWEHAFQQGVLKFAWFAQSIRRSWGTETTNGTPQSNPDVSQTPWKQLCKRQARGRLVRGQTGSCSRLRLACPLRHARHAVLRPRWPRSGTAQPGRAQRHLGTHCAPQQRSAPRRSASCKDVEKPGHGKSPFLSDSDLFARCNKAQVQGNSSGLQYVKFCSLCQDWCRRFQEMIPNLLTGEQNVLLGDFMVIKLMAVANFKKHYHLNAWTMTNFRFLFLMIYAQKAQVFRGTAGHGILQNHWQACVGSVQMHQPRQSSFNYQQKLLYLQLMTANLSA